MLFFLSTEFYGTEARDSPESATSIPLCRVVCKTPTPGSYASEATTATGTGYCLTAFLPVVAVPTSTEWATIFSLTSMA